jgi:two-component system LytT family response regulator
MLRALVIDDEVNIRNMIIEIIKKYCNGTRVVGQAGSVQEGLSRIRDLNPDLVLLDIKMDDGTGFDLLEKLEKINFKVIFVTAYQEFALQAIKFSALDYILKPVDPEELISAIDAAGDLILEQQQIQIEHLTDSIKSNHQDSKKILLKTSENIHLVKFSDIIYFEADSGYTRFYLSDDRSIVVSKSLAEYEDFFKDFGFYRVHKSYIVNLQKILRFEKEDGGNLVMEEDHKVPVASRKKDQILQIFENMAN